MQPLLGAEVQAEQKNEKEAEIEAKAQTGIQLAGPTYVHRFDVAAQIERIQFK